MQKNFALASMLVLTNFKNIIVQNKSSLRVKTRIGQPKRFLNASGNRKRVEKGSGLEADQTIKDVQDYRNCGCVTMFY